MTDFSPIPGGRDPVLQQIMGRADKNFTSTQDAMKASQARQDALMQEKQAALAPVQGEMAKRLDEPSPAAPKMPNLPDAPKPVHIDTKEMSETLSLVMGLAAITGAISRQPLTAALNSFSEGVKGYVQGKKEVFDESFKTFNQEIAKARTENEAKWKEYQAARQEHKDNIQAMQNKLSLIAAKYDAPIELELIHQGRLMDFYKMGEKQNDTFAKLKMNQDRVDESKRAHDQAHADRVANNPPAGATSGLTPEGQAVAEELTRAGKPMPKTRRGMRDDELLNAMGAHQAGGAGSGSIIAGQAQYKADSQSLATQQKRVDGIELFANKVGKDIKVLEKFLDSGSIPGVTLTNEPINALRRKFSSPSLAQLDLAAKQVGTEYERLINGGGLSIAQLHEGAREDAAKIINGNMSVPEIKAKIPVMLNEIQNAKDAAYETMDAIRARMIKPQSRRSTDAKPAEAWTDEKEKRYQELKAKHGPE